MLNLEKKNVQEPPPDTGIFLKTSKKAEEISTRIGKQNTMQTKNRSSYNRSNNQVDEEKAYTMGVNLCQLSSVRKSIYKLYKELEN